MVVAMAMAEDAGVEVLKYERTMKGSFYQHRAIIETDSLGYLDELEVVKTTSDIVGFNTLMYQLSKHSIQEHPTRSNCYLVKWETGLK